MIRICIDDIPYLISTKKTSNLINIGELKKNYYDSSIEINGGRIWHPHRGHSKITISIQIDETNNSKWCDIFKKEIDFCEESIKKNEESFKIWYDIETETAIKNNIKPDLTKLKKIKKIIDTKIKNGKTCIFNSFSLLELNNNDYKVILFFRELHKYENEIQISGFTYMKK